MVNLTFLGWIEEDDGTLTAECADENGKIHEFRNCKLTGIEEPSGGGIEVKTWTVSLPRTPT